MAIHQKGIETMKQKETVFTKLANVIQKAADELEKADPNYFMLCTCWAARL